MYHFHIIEILKCKKKRKQEPPATSSTEIFPTNFWHIFFHLFPLQLYLNMIEIIMPLALCPFHISLNKSKHFLLFIFSLSIMDKDVATILAFTASLTTYCREQRAW